MKEEFDAYLNQPQQVRPAKVLHLISFGFFEFEWGFYALSASKAIFRARNTIILYNLFSPVMMITR